VPGAGALISLLPTHRGGLSCCVRRKRKAPLHARLGEWYPGRRNVLGDPKRGVQLLRSSPDGGDMGEGSRKYGLKKNSERNSSRICREEDISGVRKVQDMDKGPTIWGGN